MTRQELLYAINNRQNVFYQGTPYLAVGYKFLILRNEKQYFAGLKDLKRDSYLWCGLEEVKTENDADMSADKE